MKLKFLHTYTDRHGKRRYYVRMDGQKHSLPDPGEMEVPNAAFIDKYREIVGARVALRKRTVVEMYGRIYVAGFSDYVKIGFTTGTVRARLNVLSTGCPEAIVLLVDIPGTRRDEGALHKRFSAYRLRGEWFRLTGELLGWVRLNQRDRMTNPAKVSQSDVYNVM